MSHNNEQKNQGNGNDESVEIFLDGHPVTSPSKTLNGRQTRELGPGDRVEGFETQEENENGKKKRTIRDDETIELHKGEHFRTVPNEGGPGVRS